MLIIDPFIVKFINKLMKQGKKRTSLVLLRQVLFLLKQKVGFQPFFILKHIAFHARQLFRFTRITFHNKKDKKKKKENEKEQEQEQEQVTRQIFIPFFLKTHNQLAYSINHIFACARGMKDMPFYKALFFVLLNCFFIGCIDHSDQAVYPRDVGLDFS